MPSAWHKRTRPEVDSSGAWFFRPDSEFADECLKHDNCYLLVLHASADDFTKGVVAFTFPTWEAMQAFDTELMQTPGWNTFPGQPDERWLLRNGNELTKKILQAIVERVTDTH